MFYFEHTLDARLYCICESHILSHILPMLLQSHNLSHLWFFFFFFVITASLYQSPPLSQHSLPCVLHWTEPSEKLKRGWWYCILVNVKLHYGRYCNTDCVCTVHFLCTKIQNTINVKLVHLPHTVYCLSLVITDVIISEVFVILHSIIRRTGSSPLAKCRPLRGAVTLNGIKKSLLISA